MAVKVKIRYNSSILSPHHTLKRVGRQNEGYIYDVSSQMRSSAIALTSYRDTGEAQSLLDVKDILDKMVRRQDDRIRDESVLVTLHGAYHGRLSGGRLVMVDDTDTPEKLNDMA